MHNVLGKKCFGIQGYLWISVGAYTRLSMRHYVEIKARICLFNEAQKNFTGKNILRSHKPFAFSPYYERAFQAT